MSEEDEVLFVKKPASASPPTVNGGRPGFPTRAATIGRTTNTTPLPPTPPPPIPPYQVSSPPVQHQQQQQQSPQQTPQSPPQQRPGFPTRAATTFNPFAARTAASSSSPQQRPQQQPPPPTSTSSPPAAAPAPATSSPPSTRPILRESQRNAIGTAAPGSSPTTPTNGPQPSPYSSSSSSAANGTSNHKPSSAAAPPSPSNSPALSSSAPPAAGTAPTQPPGQTRRQSTSAANGSNGSNGSAAPPPMIDIQVSCRNLSSNTCVVALFEAKANKSLEYVGHTEGIRNSHHPDFQQHLRIAHRKGTNQKVKFNVYTLPPVHTRVEEKSRIGSAYVYLDEIAKNLGVDLLIDLVHGQNPEKDKNNAWLKTHLLIKACLSTDRPEQERLEKVKATAVPVMKEGRILKLYDPKHLKPPKNYLFFYRPDSDLGRIFWIEPPPVNNPKIPERFDDPDKVVESGWTDYFSLMDILALYENHQMPAFKHPTKPEWSSNCPERSFSVSLSNRTVDVEAPTPETHESFMLGMHDILTSQREKELDSEEFKIIVKCRNLPLELQEGGLFCALSARDTKSLPYEIVNKTGWLAASAAPEFPKPMAVDYVCETQSLKFDLYHNSFNDSDGAGTAIVIYKELKEQLGQMVIVPLRNMSNPEMDELLLKHKSTMIISCLEYNSDDEINDDEVADVDDSDEESSEYYGEKMKKLREKNRDMFGQNGDDGDLFNSITSLPPPPQPIPKVSVALYSGYLLDKYAFNTKGCQTKLVFIAKDMSIKESSDTATSKSPGLFRLYWCKPGKPVRSLDSSFNLNDLSNITLGKKTSTLQRKDAADASDACCVSLHWGGRTLDLAADSQLVRDAFVLDLINFLLPKSRVFSAYESCSTRKEDEEYARLVRLHQDAIHKTEAEVRQRLANKSSFFGGGNNTDMPDLQAAMSLLQKLHDKGMAKLGLDPSSEFVSAKKNKKGHADIMSSLAALDDIFSELDSRFATGGLSAEGGSGKKGKSGKNKGFVGTHGDTFGSSSEEDDDDDDDEDTSPKGRRGKRSGKNKRLKLAEATDDEDDGANGAEAEVAAAKAEAVTKKLETEKPKPGETSEERAKRLDEVEKKAHAMKLNEVEDDEDEKAMEEINKKLANKQAITLASASPESSPDPNVPQAPSLDFVVGNAPPPPPMGIPPPPAPFFTKAPASRKIKQLHWETLSTSEVTNTIFSSLNSSALDDGENPELDELFANHIAKKVEQKKKSSNGISLIDSKRAYNIEIGISRIKMNNSEIKTAILELNPEVLTEEKAQLLLDRVPTLEELAILKKYTGKTEELGNVEQFLLMMATIPMCGLRLELHLFRLRFPEIAGDLKMKLKVMFNACKSLTTSTNLARVYQLVLQVGNYLNQGTRKGNASGFKLASLGALSNTKSFDGKLTLLDYVVSRVDKQFKTPEDREKKVPFLSDIHVLKDAVNYDWQVVQDEHRRMRTVLKKVQNIVIAPPTEQDPNATVVDRFHASMTSFYNLANEDFKLLTKRLKRIMQLEEQLLTFFGESKEKTNLSLLFSLLNSFASSFEMSEMNMKSFTASLGNKAKKANKIGGGDDGVIDPRLGNNFSSMLQGVKLKSKNHRHLASNYAGRKQQNGQTIQPIMDSPAAEHVQMDSIAFDFGGAGGAAGGDTVTQYSPAS